MIWFSENFLMVFRLKSLFILTIALTITYLLNTIIEECLNTRYLRKHVETHRKTYAI